MAIAMLFPITAFAQAYVQTWDLVDSGKHLDYDGNSTYMSYINTGAATWNAYKSGVIRKDSAFVVEDVYVSDVNASNGWAGMTYSSGKIELNTYYMSGYSNSKKQNVATHELGHALGLDTVLQQMLWMQQLRDILVRRHYLKMIKIHMMPHIIIIRGGRTL